MSQLTLFSDKDKRQTFLDNIDPNDCVIDPFNSRKTRPPEDVERLAARMHQYGYDKTRAVWARYNKDGILSVFAGGTRLDAAKQIGVKVAVILHEGYSDEEIAWLTELDNESDEYHIPVNPIDIWAEYARLQDEEGWDKQQIADAKGFSYEMVRLRLKLNNLPKHIKQFTSQGFLTEGHLTEICKIQVNLYFSSWLTTEQAWKELAEWAAKGYPISKTKDKVKQWKVFIALAEEYYGKFKTETLYEFHEEREPTPFEYDAPAQFIEELVKRSRETKIRSANKIREAERFIRLFIADNVQRYTEWLTTKNTEEQKKAEKARREKEIANKYLRGNCLELYDQLEDNSVRLLLVDPPYGKDFQSNRRVRSVKAPKIIGDMPDEAIELFSAMLETYKPKLQEEVHILSFCDWQHEPDFRNALEKAGFILRGSLIWVKENHSAGDLQGTFAPKHDRILHATLGRPSVEPRIDDVLIFPRDLDSEHPTAKPVPLLEKLILSCTNEGDLVIDTMAGCGSTLLAAWNLDREFWGCEIDEYWHDLGQKNLFQKLEEELDGKSAE